MNKLRYDDGSRKYVTLGEHQGKRETCSICNGTGRDPEGEHYEGSASSRCPKCKGIGRT